MIAIWLAAGWGGDSVTTAVTDIGSLLAALIAAGACALTARRRRVDRGAWLGLAVACGLWALGEAKWSWDEVLLQHEVPFPSFADAAFLAAVPIALLALLRFDRGTHHNRVRTLLDGALVAGSLLFAIWALVLGPMWETSAESTLAQVVNLAYPFTDLAMVTVALLLVRWGNVRHRVPLALLAASLVVMSCTDLLFTYLTNNGSYSSTNVVSVGWIASYLLIALAARVPRAASVSDAADAGADDAEPLASVLLPYVALGIAFVVAAGRLLDHRSLDAFLTANAVVLTVVLLVRQAFSLRDNRALVARLDEAVHLLNAREAQLEHLAGHDGLTGLANRSRFVARAEEMMASDATPPAVIYVDLDGFKAVNDHHGHATGDQVLVEAARRLAACTRSDDLLARFGGDEFVLLLPGGYGAATACARRIAEQFADGFTIDGESIDVTASIGIAVTSRGGSADEALRFADAAMYAAKRSGRGRAVVYPDVSLVL